MDVRDEVDEEFQRRQWRVQRAGWVLMGLVVVASLLGLFGTSPLAGRVVAKEVDGARYEVEYPRFARYENADRIHLRVHAPAAQGDQLSIAFSRGFVENAMLRSSAPEPDGGGASASGAVYSYKVEDWSQPIAVTFEYEPRKAFWTAGVATVTAGQGRPVELPLDQWVHP